MHSRCGWGGGRRQQVREAGSPLLPAQPGAPRGEQRPQSGGRGRAGCGPPWRAPGTSRWLPVPVPGPCRVRLGLGAGQRGQPNRGPYGLLRPMTQPHTRPPQGRQWWPVVLGGPPGRCEPRGGLGLSFLLWTTGLITQVEDLTARCVDRKCHVWDNRESSDGPACCGGRGLDGPQAPQMDPHPASSPAHSRCPVIARSLDGPFPHFMECVQAIPATPAQVHGLYSTLGERGWPTLSEAGDPKRPGPQHGPPGNPPSWWEARAGCRPVGSGLGHQEGLGAEGAVTPDSRVH